MSVLDTANVRLGQIVITRSALDMLPSHEAHAALQRHARGDWGDLDEHDWHANESALVNGSRLFSVYHAQATKFWIITEADRSATTILLPEDY